MNRGGKGIDEGDTPDRIDEIGMRDSPPWESAQVYNIYGDTSVAEIELCNSK